MLKNFKKFPALAFLLITICSSFTFAMESSSDTGRENLQRKRSHSNAGGEGIMPIEIYNALNRLDLQQWNPGITSEYRENLANRDLYAATLAVEYEDGEKAGLEKGEQIGLKKAKREAITQMRSMSMQDSIIAQALQITEQQLQELMTEEA